MASKQAKAQLASDISNHLDIDNLIANLIDDIVTSVAESLKPEDVFDESQLKAWAEENGFVQKEE